uniref:NADH dehydrogenase subunit 4L n=1 Tax=Histiostoma blomquisti TaxID=1902798 RepID=A0A342Y127_9ACAR|nr:NADH dehydrogenase subunit 4L [Histiostoma blomquisti]AOR08479.1 NADH dehydrogenase subunit 4L [Histiostoma blomquisti]
MVLSGAIFIMFCFFIFFYSSLQVMVVLLMLESFILLAVFYMSLNFFWFSLVMLIMVGVCLGAFGISVMISSVNSKSYLYFYSS